MNPNATSLLSILTSPSAQPGTTPALTRATLVFARNDGVLVVRLHGEARDRDCETLDSLDVSTLQPGDSLLVADVAGGWVAVGRIGVLRRPQSPRELELVATERLRLRCGDASLELASDGKVLLKGDDVVVRAKGTKRIRAGHVAIN